MTPEEYGKDIARRLAAGMAASRPGVASAASALTGSSARQGVTVQVHVTGNTVMSDDDIETLVRKIGRKLGARKLGGDGEGGARVPVPRQPKPPTPAGRQAAMSSPDR